MDAQEPGPGKKLAAGTQGPWPRVKAHGTLANLGPPPILGQGLALGPRYVTILCIHMCPCVYLLEGTSLARCALLFVQFVGNNRATNYIHMQFKQQINMQVRGRTYNYI